MATKETKKKEKKPRSKADKVLTRIIRTLVVLLTVIVVTSATLGTLVYFDVLNIGFINDIFIAAGIKDVVNNEPTKEETQEEVAEESSDPVEEPEVETDNEDMSTHYEVTPPDADQYFKDNATVSSEVKAEESKNVHSEADTYNALVERGFGDMPITTEYSMEGEYSEAYEISSYSSTQHPMYQTYYVTQAGDVWVILEINGVVMANPLSYNEDKDVPVVISETKTITSYDSTLNKFYVHVPNDDVMIVKTVKKINAETLEKLTAGEIDKL